ncbi:MAG: FGGY family carbohydrate kinase, partial [Elusimicrobia bacterium]|nr:FGGY family carbohydrate kinase [Elusimicrobiota bacterium]
MAEKCFIVIDQGSSSSRAFAVSVDGKILAGSRETLSADFPQPGWAQYDAQELLNSQLLTLKEVLDSLPPDIKPQSIGIASQRSSVVFWDGKNGAPLAPIISWQDGRASAEANACQTSQEKIHQITGLYKTPYYSAPKILWALKNYPAVKKSLGSGRLKVGPVASYILWHLTGGESFSVDPTLAQRTMLFDINKLCWSGELLEAFSIPLSVLPEVKPSFGNFGMYEDIPISVMLGDQQAAFCGAGSNAQIAALNCGTGAFFLAGCGDKPINVPGILTTVAHQDE